MTVDHEFYFSADETAVLSQLSGASPFGCTSLLYQDAKGLAYFGRTLELPMDLPYRIAYLPAGIEFSSTLGDHSPVSYQSCHAMLTVVMPDRVPSATSPITLADLKIVEGINSEGLTFSLLAYPMASGTAVQAENTKAILAATDLGSWTLGQFSNVAEVKAALASQPVALDSPALLGGVEAPFHYVLHDRDGASIVIEFHQGKQTVYDNPVGVMTNGPQFSWHLTNLNNYTFLSNVDQSSNSFGKLSVCQPDSGIATAGLPASNTSVGRFVRAVFYSQFAEKVSEPDDAICTLAHIMNNFDRPKGISVSPRSGGARMKVEGFEPSDLSHVTEFTSWTNLTDLSRGLFFLRAYESLNYTEFDLRKLASLKTVKSMPLSELGRGAINGTARLLSA